MTFLFLNTDCDGLDGLNGLNGVAMAANPSVFVSWPCSNLPFRHFAPKAKTNKTYGKAALWQKQ